ncbi:hypothetical protein ACFVYP_35990 [Kitasatospora sp. NPDC058201]|uniref:hypothetical protein n=1 Tax=unclassified Kitasatospora TaxID=2633591 RepID=UPI0036570254
MVLLVQGVAVADPQHLGRDRRDGRGVRPEAEGGRVGADLFVDGVGPGAEPSIDTLAVGPVDRGGIGGGEVSRQVATAALPVQASRPIWDRFTRSEVRAAVTGYLIQVRGGGGCRTTAPGRESRAI